MQSSPRNLQSSEALRARYAINVLDLAAADPIALMPVVASVTPSRLTVEAEPSVVAGVALVLECPDEQAAAICEVVRLKYHRNALRCYERESGRWKRL